MQGHRTTMPRRILADANGASIDRAATARAATAHREDTPLTRRGLPAMSVEAVRIKAAHDARLDCVIAERDARLAAFRTPVAATEALR